MKLKGSLLVLIGAASFGFTPIFVKKGFEYGYTLGQLNITQMVIAFVLLWVLCLFKRVSIKDMNRKDALQVMLTGTSVGLTGIFYYGAMQYLPASLAIILLFQFVWVGMIYEWIFSKSKPTKINMISMVVTLTGVFFASDVFQGEVLDLPGMGILLGFLSAITYAGFIFFSGIVAPKTDPVLRSWFMVTGSTILILIVFMKDIPTIQMTDGRLWVVGAGIALVGAVIPPLFFAGGAPHISGRLANVLGSVELPVAIISAMVILSETVTLLQWLGILLIICAILINEFGGKLMYSYREAVDRSG
ncbi:EamA family transporter [Halobacillus litoralis]|uniref:Multidrug DMT transporter permease n=1 Tax=Halobacillus litoralis TaxID=45668 RepID=A0A410MIC7_9BACI|nr:DMT family transporter [Halobacillus litoralis]QAS54405.1 multidrug DMT transporter permease [Halobacillus litoralis]